MSEPVESRPSFFQRALAELGLTSLAVSSSDIKLLCLQRFVRLFAYGASTLILVAFLTELGNSKERSGLFMTLTLVGDIFISLILTLIADRVGRKAILAIGAALMTLSGAVFAVSSNYWVLLVAAVLGVISPSGNEIGPFKAIEESIIAHLTPTDQRSDIFAWYTLFGFAGTASGMMVGGWVIEILRLKFHWDIVRAYRIVFVVYAALGLVKFAMAICLSRKVESEPKLAAEQSDDAQPSESSRLLPDQPPSEATPPKKRRFALFATLSAESQRIVAVLCLLFAFDAFGAGLAPLSWITYYFKSRFGIDEGALGSIFFTASIISSISVLVASPLSKRLGDVKTMVFTHLPSSVFLALLPLPSNSRIATLLLLLRSSLQSMDSAPRSAFLAKVLLPEERTSVIGMTNVVKTMAQSAGPLITGVLAGRNLFWVGFVAAGSFKMAYDLGMFVVFSTYERSEAH